MDKTRLVCEVLFDDNSQRVLDINEDVLVSEMEKPKQKRLYKCGIEFSRVNQVNVLEEK